MKTKKITNEQEIVTDIKIEQVKKPKNKKLLIIILLSIIGIMALFLAYYFLVIPFLNNVYRIGYNEGQIILLNDILTSIQQNGYAGIPLQNGTFYLMEVPRQNGM